MERLTIVFLLISISIYGQHFTNRQTQKIEYFDIKINELNLENQQIIDDLNYILQTDKKSKRKKVVGKVLATLSVLSITGGILILTQDDNQDTNRNYDEASAYREFIGGFLFATGVLESGISIPVFVSSKKKRRSRNKKIKIYNEDWNE